MALMSNSFSFFVHLLQLFLFPLELSSDGEVGSDDSDGGDGVDLDLVVDNVDDDDLIVFDALNFLLVFDDLVMELFGVGMEASSVLSSSIGSSLIGVETFVVVVMFELLLACCWSCCKNRV